MRAPAAAVAVVAGLAVLTGCSTGSATPAEGPQAWCERALGADKVLTAGPATAVDDLRSVTMGPGYKPAKDAFPGVAGTAPATFCWTKGSGDQYDSYGVTGDGKSVKLASVGGIPGPPTGAPVVP
jgi:hypothetical protein